jgi:RNA polymerase sigma-70 factor (ECF subfamily)
VTPGEIPEGGAKRAAFEAAALPFMQALYNTALRLTADGDEAADIVQETFLRAYRTFDNFRPGSNARAWLFTILYSVFVNQYHHAKRRPRMESLDELEAPAGPESDITLVVAWGSRWSPEVERALRRLPEDFRTPLLLIDIEGLSYEEAAAVLGCAVGTIGSRLFRGRKLLYAMLQDYAHRAGYGKDTARP